MALIVGEKGSVFLHIPKTGGTWFRQAAYESGLRVEQLNGQHGTIGRLINTKVVAEDYFNNRLVFSIVRHPLTWYQSRWCFRVKYGWHAEHPLDLNCASNDFCTFLERVLEFKPDGWVSWLYRIYNESPKHPIDFVARTENLVNDLVEWLQQQGEDFDEVILRNFQPLNDSKLDDRTSGYWAKYTPELFDRIMVVEQEALSKYYPDYEVDPKRFIGERPY
jgi:hypothetical protein